MNFENIVTSGFHGAASSNIGGRPENQDSYKWGMTPVGLAITVCDGMGGGPAGKTASSIAVDTILQTLQGLTPSANLEQAVENAVQTANVAVYDKSCTNPDLHGMGSTCTLLLLTDHEAITAYVGDSRIYQLRGHKKQFRTFDHSMVFELVKQKVITEEQARLSSQSNVITRALGLGPKVEIDVQTLSYKKGDRFVLTSDGIHGVIPEKELIGDVTDKSKPLTEIVDKLTDKIESIGKSKGGSHDNMTIVLLEAGNINDGNSSFGAKVKAFFRKLFLLAILMSGVQVAVAQQALVLKANVGGSAVPVHGKIWKLHEADGRSVLVNVETGSRLTAAYDSITDFSGDYALGLDKDGGRFHINAIINRNNQEVTYPKTALYATNVPYFSEGVVGVSNDRGMEGFMDVNGKLALRCNYVRVSPFLDGVASVVKKNQTKVFVNHQGKTVMATDRDEAEVVRKVIPTVRISENQTYVPFQENGLWGYRSVSGRIVPAQFEMASPFSDKYASVKLNDAYGILMIDDQLSFDDELKIASPDTQYFVYAKGGNGIAGDVKVVLKASGAESVELPLKEQNGQILVYSIDNEATKNPFDLFVSYKGVQQLQKHYEKVKSQNDDKAAGSNVGLVIKGFSPKSSRADKNDQVYMNVNVANTSGQKATGTLTVYIDGKPYASRISLGANKSNTITVPIKVMKERYAKVYVKPSNGQRTPVKEFNFKPFY